MKLSVTLATYYADAGLIDRCLTAVKTIADEIIIVYGQEPSGKDKALSQVEKLAKKYHARLTIVANNYENFHRMKKLANAQATGDWILQLDTDEIVSQKLAGEIKTVITRSPAENGYWIPRANYFLGRFLKKGGAYPDYTLRLYRRGFGDLPAKSVHEQATVTGNVGYLHNDLLHYNNPTFGVYIDRRFQHYTDIMARTIRGGLLRNLIWEPLFNRQQGFFSIYFWHLGFLDGFPGFVWALFSALHFPVAYFKSLDIHEGRAN